MKNEEKKTKQSGEMEKIKEVKVNTKDEKIEKGGIMKNKIVTFAIGVLVGAIITAAIFLIFKPNNKGKVPDFSQFNRNGEKVIPGDKNIDPSNFKQGERRSRRNKDNTSENDSNVDDAKPEDKQDEKQG